MKLEQVKNWAIANHSRIEAALYGVSFVWWFVSRIAIRTIGGAAACLAYLFATATPDTTVYMLSQAARSDRFWVMSIVLSVAYTGLNMAFGEGAPLLYGRDTTSAAGAGRLGGN